MSIPAERGQVPAPTGVGAHNRPGRWRAGGLILLVLLVYFPATRAGFVFDDQIYITENPLMVAPQGWTRFWVTTEFSDYYPLSNTVLWLQWRLWGDRPAGYHVVNIICQAMVVLLAWRVLTRLAVPGAWWVAALFAVHPVAVTTVAWISELKNLLALGFGLASLDQYLRFRATGQRVAYAIAGLLFLAALLSKSALAPWPIVMGLCAYWLTGQHWRARELRELLPFAGLSLVMGVVTIWFEQQRGIAGLELESLSLAGRLALAGRALWFYAGKAVLPWHLNLIYPRWAIEPLHWWSFAPLAAAVALFLVLWRVRRQPWARAGLVGGGGYVALLLPVLGFADIAFQRFSWVADHWQYLALLPLLATIAGGIIHTLSARRTPQPVVGACGVVLLSGLMIASWSRCWVFTDAATLWRETLARNPKAWVAHYNLGNELRDQDQLTAAIQHYQAAIRLNPGCAGALANLGVALVRLGRPAEAIAPYRRALALEPSRFYVRCNLGDAYARLGQWAQAEAAYRALLAQHPDFAPAHFNLGLALVARGKLDAAEQALQRARTLTPADPDVYAELGRVYLLQQRHTAAIRMLQEALTLRPDQPTAVQLLPIAERARDASP